MAISKSLLVGRVDEQQRLQAALDSPNAELVAVYGRRRVGKTFLVSQFFAPRVDVLCTATGEKDASLPVQLYHFQRSLRDAFGDTSPPPDSWRQAFERLADWAERRRNERVCVFLDELPWMSTRRSGLLQALDYCWNTRLSKLPKLTVVVCGSAAAWMLDKLIHAKGGLYNRITRRIHLAPFRINETRAFLASRGVRLGTRQVLEIYMAIGGVPHYLMQVERGWSAAQAVARICFDRSGILHDEYDRLFASLFDGADVFDRLVRAIAETRAGTPLAKLRGLPELSSGGRLASRLRELVAAGFIAELVPWGYSRRDKVYRIIDPFVLFHLRWIEKAPRGLLAANLTDYWLGKSATPAYRAWAGYAFESMCLEHAAEIRRALGIASIATDTGTWRFTAPRRDANVHGAQVDLLFDRADGIINLCELKYCSDEYVVTKSYARELKRKLEVFERQTRTKKDVCLTLVTTHGLRHNAWSRDLIASVVTADELFRA